MLMHEEKKALMTIMRKRNAKDGKIESEAPMKQEKVMDEDGEIDGRHVASQDMIAALHEKSPEKLMNAMGAFIDLHQMHTKPFDSPDVEGDG